MTADKRRVNPLKNEHGWSVLAREMGVGSSSKIGQALMQSRNQDVATLGDAGGISDGLHRIDDLNQRVRINL